MTIKILSLIIVLFTFLTLIGCGSHTTNFVVYRHVPENPSFVVIPSNNGMCEVTFANEIESALISCHVSVLLRPTTKAVEKEQAAGETKSESSNKSIEKTSITEWYFEFEEITADYIIQTYDSSYHVKISKRDTREIIAVLKIPKYEVIESGTLPTPREIVYGALVNLEIIPPTKQ